MYRLSEGVITAITDSGSFKLDSIFRLHMQRIAFSYKKMSYLVILRWYKSMCLKKFCQVDIGLTLKVCLKDGVWEIKYSSVEGMKSTGRYVNDLLVYLLILISIVIRRVFRDDLYIPWSDMNIGAKCQVHENFKAQLPPLWELGPLLILNWYLWPCHSFWTK